MTHETTINDLAEFRLLEWDKGKVMLGIPGTEYQLSLDAGEGVSADGYELGRRIRGRVVGQALKVHRPSAGGNFIEPVHGHPRIVQGTVIAAAPASRQLLIDLVVPVWVELMPSQSATEFSTGDLLNFYMKSGISFTPVE